MASPEGKPGRRVVFLVGTTVRGREGGGGGGHRRLHSVSCRSKVGEEVGMRAVEVAVGMAAEAVGCMAEVEEWTAVVEEEWRAAEEVAKCTSM